MRSEASAEQASEALRGSSDFQASASRCVDGISLLPYFIALEHNKDFLVPSDIQTNIDVVAKCPVWNH